MFRAGRAIGHNKYTTGFARAIESDLPGARLDRVVLVGAGGAGAACAHALLTLGAGRVEVFDLQRARAEALVAALTTRFGSGRAVAGHSIATELSTVDGLVHATPTGMDTHPRLPVPAELLTERLWVADVVYRPLNTALVERARARGCRVLDGGRMAVFQAADAFRLFTGHNPDADRMLRHLVTLEAPCTTV